VDTRTLAEQLRSSGLISQAAGFSYWSRGGDPGEGYSSDLLAFRATGGEIAGEYVRTRFDEAYDPPYLSERFARPVAVPEADAIVQAALASDLFSRTLTAETQPPVADILKETWTLTWSGQELSKTLFEPLPDDLRALRSHCQDLMAKLAQSGRRETLSRKRGE
jgi:hypothetical protein